jgi:hypothetical protein
MWDKDFAWLSGSFAEAVSSIGHTLLVPVPWHAPLALTRAWCLWELHCTLQACARLDVALLPSEAAAFRQALRERFDQVAAAFARVDLFAAHTDKPVERAAIRLAVLRADGGFEALNERIQCALYGALWRVGGELTVLVGAAPRASDEDERAIVIAECVSQQGDQLTLRVLAHGAGHGGGGAGAPALLLAPVSSIVGCGRLARMLHDGGAPPSLPPAALASWPGVQGRAARWACPAHPARTLRLGCAASRAALLAALYDALCPSPEQAAAALALATHRLAPVHGAPGTGKTALAAACAAAFLAAGEREAERAAAAAAAAAGASPPPPPPLRVALCSGDAHGVDAALALFERCSRDARRLTRLTQRPPAAPVRILRVGADAEGAAGNDDGELWRAPLLLVAGAAGDVARRLAGGLKLDLVVCDDAHRVRADAEASVLSLVNPLCGRVLLLGDEAAPADGVAAGAESLLSAARGWLRAEAHGSAAAALLQRCALRQLPERPERHADDGVGAPRVPAWRGRPGLAVALADAAAAVVPLPHELVFGAFLRRGADDARDGDDEDEDEEDAADAHDEPASACASLPFLPATLPPPPPPPQQQQPELRGVAARWACPHDPARALRLGGERDRLAWLAALTRGLQPTQCQLAVAAALTTHRLVPVHGAPGSGRTALALAACLSFLAAGAAAAEPLARRRRRAPPPLRVALCSGDRRGAGGAMERLEAALRRSSTASADWLTGAARAVRVERVGARATFGASARGAGADDDELRRAPLLLLVGALRDVARRLAGGLQLHLVVCDDAHLARADEEESLLSLVHPRRGRVLLLGDEAAPPLPPPALPPARAREAPAPGPAAAAPAPPRGESLLSAARGWLRDEGEGTAAAALLARCALLENHTRCAALLRLAARCAGGALDAAGMPCDEAGCSCRAYRSGASAHAGGGLPLDAQLLSAAASALAPPGAHPDCLLAAADPSAHLVALRVASAAEETHAAAALLAAMAAAWRGGAAEAQHAPEHPALAGDAYQAHFLERGVVLLALRRAQADALLAALPAGAGALRAGLRVVALDDASEPAAGAAAHALRAAEAALLLAAVPEDEARRVCGATLRAALSHVRCKLVVLTTLDSDPHAHVAAAAAADHDGDGQQLPPPPPPCAPALDGLEVLRRVVDTCASSSAAAASFDWARAWAEPHARLVCYHLPHRLLSLLPPFRDRDDTSSSSSSSSTSAEDDG